MCVGARGVQDTAIALCEAAYKGDLDSIVTLVENGVDPNLSDYDGRTALHLAASEEVVKVLDYLLNVEPKVDVNPVDAMGGTPLDDAIRHQQTVAQTMLLKAGGLTQGDPKLEILQEHQDIANTAIQRKMRTAKVNAVIKTNKEVVYFDTFLEIFATFDPAPAKVEVSGDRTDVLQLTVGEEEEGEEERGPSTFMQRLDRFQDLLSTFLEVIDSNERCVQGCKSKQEAQDVEINTLQLPNQVFDQPENVAMEGFLKVNVCSAMHLPKMDVIGTCDAFCEVRWQDQIFKSSVIKNSLNPTWEETFTFPFTKTDDLGALGDVTLVLMDWNMMSGNKEVGFATIGKEVLERVCDGETFPDDAGWHHLSLELSQFQPSGSTCLGHDGAQSLVHARIQCVFPEQPLAFFTTKLHSNTPMPRSKRSPLGLDLDRLTAQYQQLLHLLSSMYSALPEISDSAPKIYHLAGTEYKKRRKQVRESILRNAQLIIYLASQLEGVNEIDNE